MACVPLIREIVSLASSTSGLICARFSASALGIRDPLSSKHSPSPISDSARCARGARSPLAPTLPCDGTIGSDAAVEHFAERVDDDGANAGVAFGQRIRAQQHHGASFGDGERFADADRVRANQIDLQFANLLAGDADVAQFAHAGGDGVGQFVAGDDLVDDGARQIDGLASVGIEQDGAARCPCSATSRTASSVRSFPLM